MVPSDREIPRAVNEGIPITIALPNADAPPRQALQRAWQAARGCDPSVAATILVKGRRLLGPTWDPAAPTRHRHRATSAQK